MFNVEYRGLETKDSGGKRPAIVYHYHESSGRLQQTKSISRDPEWIRHMFHRLKTRNQRKFAWTKIRWPKQSKAYSFPDLFFRGGMRRLGWFYASHIVKSDFEELFEKCPIAGSNVERSIQIW